MASPANLAPAGKMSHLRWVICALLFLATVIAYVDRGVIAYLEKFLETVIPGLNSIKYGYILAAFQAAYAIGMVVAGGLTDKLGTRKAFAIAICLWSVAAMLPAWHFQSLHSPWPCFCSGWARRRTSLPASRRWLSGFQKGARAGHRDLQFRR